MSAVMEKVGTRPAPVGKVVTPPELREVIERHLEGLAGLPTLEIVEAICKDIAATSHKEKVLKYFLLESPLRPRDLGTLLCSIGKNRASQLCQEVARTRARRHLSGGNPPRWEDVATS